MEYFELIEKRHSVRAYKPDRVEDEKLQKILEAGRLAPTACNLQAFKLYVIDTRKNEAALRKLYGREWLVQAPIVIGVCAIPGKNWVRSDGKNYSDVDASIVMDHIILAATALGLGTCWIGAFNPTVARELLGLDGELEPVAFTPIGYPADGAFRKNRKNLDEIVIYK